MYRPLAILLCLGIATAQAQIDSVTVVTSAPRTILKSDVPMAAMGVDHLEKKPDFHGGTAAMHDHLLTRMATVARRTAADEVTRVEVQFVVEADGMVNEAQVLQGGDPKFNHALLNALMVMPDWVPGNRNGAPVRSLVRISLPIAPL